MLSSPFAQPALHMGDRADGPAQGRGAAGWDLAPITGGGVPGHEKKDYLTERARSLSQVYLTPTISYAQYDCLLLPSFDRQPRAERQAG